jgi:hypothetical protein
MRGSRLSQVYSDLFARHVYWAHRSQAPRFRLERSPGSCLARPPQMEGPCSFLDYRRPRSRWSLFYVNRIHNFRLTRTSLDSILVPVTNGNEYGVNARLKIQSLLALFFLDGR